MYEIEQADKNKHKTLMRELQFMNKKCKNIELFTKNLNDELRHAVQNDQGDKKLSVFLSKRIWQIVSLIDNYADCTVDMYNIRFEKKESL